MVRPTNRDEYMALLEKSQLLAKCLFAQLRETVNANPRLESSAKLLACKLVKGDVLTEFQATQILNGRYRGFYLGNYKLLDVIGKGGMGRVYLAEQIRLQRLVALKVVRRVMLARSPQTVRRFRREARAVAALKHPNIIQAYDYDEIDGVPFIVMEYIEGMDLDRMMEKAPLPWAQAADIIAQAASGLQHAHKHSMVHRDIKPGNLLVDLDGIVKILDLGLVSNRNNRSKQALTTADDQLGTVDYIAPEQALDSRNADIRADVYSLAAVFYYITTGNPIYAGRTMAQKLLKQQTEDPTPLKDKLPDIPDELADAIHRMLSREPADRPQTPAEVEQLLQPFAERIKPPFDPDELAHRCRRFSPFLHRSPRPSSVVIRRSAADANDELSPIEEL